MGTRRSAAWLFIYQFIMIGLGIAQTAVISRALGPTWRGILYFNMTLSGTIPMLLALGLPTANIYFLGTGKISRDTILSNSLYFGGIAGLLGVVIYMISIYFYGHAVVESLSVTQIALLASITFFTVQNTLWPNLLQAEEKFFRRTLTSLIPTGLYVVVVVPMFLMHRLSFTWIVFLTVSVQLFSTGLAVSFLMPWKLQPPEWTSLKTVLVFGLIPFFANLLQLMVYRVDTFFLGVQRPPEDLGFYAVAQTLGETLWLLGGGLGVLLPLQTKRDAASRSPLTTLVCRIHFVALLMAGLSLAIFGTFLIRLIYSAQFMPAYRPLLWLIPGCIVAIIPKVLSTEFGARGRYDICLKASGISCGLNLLLNYPFIARWGTVGAAMATSLAYGAGAVLQIIEYRKLTGVRLRELLIPSRQDFEIALVKPIYRTFFGGKAPP